MPGRCAPASCTLAFACAAESPGEVRHGLLLAESIRRFGGRFSSSQVWILAPEEVADALARGPAANLAADIAAWGAELVPFALDPACSQLPFSTKTFASGIAEAGAAGKSDFLVWMDAGSLVAGEPAPLCLPPDKTFGYRPVDHTLIGSPHDQQADAFWQLIYEGCKVPESRLFPMVTTVDLRVLRPYFNAGLMVVRPERGLFRAWGDNYRRLQHDPAFEPFLAERIYRIFFHQTVLTGTVLSLLDPDDLALLPPAVSYPLHMHDQYPEATRAGWLDELTTFRHEGILDRPGWGERVRIGVREPLAGWLAERFPHKEKPRG